MMAMSLVNTNRDSSNCTIMHMAEKWGGNKHCFSKGQKSKQTEALNPSQKRYWINVEFEKTKGWIIICKQENKISFIVAELEKNQCYDF